jgi:hypothetical protein
MDVLRRLGHGNEAAVNPLIGMINQEHIGHVAPKVFGRLTPASNLFELPLIEE